MNPSSRSIAKKLVAPIFLAALLALTMANLTTNWTTRVTVPLTRYNLAFLDTSIKDTIHIMIPIGTAKAAADIIEGSTVNIEAGAIVTKAGMTIEAGDALQPMLDYLGIAWRLLLLSMTYLVTAKCVLSGANAVASPLLVISLCAFSFNSLAGLVAISQKHALRQTLHRVGALFLLCSLLFLLILPLTVAGSACLSQIITEPMREDVRGSFQQIGEIFSLDHFHETNDLKEKAVALKEKLTEWGLYAKTAITEVAVAVCKLAAIKLLNGIIFPLASFAFLIWLVRSCLCPALGLSDRPLAASDLQQISKWIKDSRQPDMPRLPAPASPETAKENA